MLVSSEKKTERGVTWILPVFSALALVLLTQLQYRIAFLENSFPFLSLIAVYYWSIYKPRLMPVMAVFILGLLQDILSGGPLGLMSLLLLLTRLFVVQQGSRFLEKEFLFNWLVFIVVSVLFGLSLWAISSLYLRDLQNIWTVLSQGALTIAIYPIVAWGLDRLRSLLVTDNR